MSTLTYRGGPLNGKTRDSKLRSGREVSAQGARDAAVRGGFSKGVYRRQGDEMVWIPVSGNWRDKP